MALKNVVVIFLTYGVLACDAKILNGWRWIATGPTGCTYPILPT